MFLRILFSVIFGCLCGLCCFSKSNKIDRIGCSILVFLFGLVVLVFGFIFFANTKSNVGILSGIAYLLIGIILLVSTICQYSTNSLVKFFGFLLIASLTGYLFFLVIKVIMTMIIVILFAFVWGMYSLFN